MIETIDIFENHYARLYAGEGGNSPQTSALPPLMTWNIDQLKASAYKWKFERFVTFRVHQNAFLDGVRPEPCWGAHEASSTLVNWGGNSPSMPYLTRQCPPIFLPNRTCWELTKLPRPLVGWGGNSAGPSVPHLSLQCPPICLPLDPHQPLCWLECSSDISGQQHCCIINVLKSQARRVLFLEVLQDLIWPLPVLARKSVVHKFYFIGFIVTKAAPRFWRWVYNFAGSPCEKKFGPPPFPYLGTQNITLHSFHYCNSTSKHLPAANDIT